VLTVEADAVSIERRLVAGDLRCPGCGQELAPWGWARPRVVRGDGQARLTVRPRRAICAVCRVTHVLLPVVMLLRRADLVDVIGAALALRAVRGAGVRTIAGVLGRPVDTVRGWLRRFVARAEAVRVLFTVVMVDTGLDPGLPAGAGMSVADAVSAVLGAAAAIAGRWPVLGTVSPWQAACAVSGGRLLAPSWP
jgi:hypothetical protein